LRTSRPTKSAPRAADELEAGAETVPEAVSAALARSDVQALQLLAGAPDKRVSKAAKRALHKLRARGLQIPDRATEKKPNPALELAAPLSDAREPAWATTVDGDGVRVILVPLKAPRGFVLHMFVSSDERGILTLTSRELSRRQLHAFIAELAPETRALLREISLATATALLTEAVNMSPASADAAGTREILRSLPLAARPLEVPGGEPAIDHTGSPLRDSTALFETPALRSYIPPEEVIRAVGQKLEEVLLSPLLIDEAQRLAQLRHALERAAADYFTAERRKRYAARLLDAAEFFSRRDDTINSARAQAVGDAFSSDLPIHEIPFARGIFDRIFDLDAAAKAHRPPTEKSAPDPGGLILPGR
jgi:hypothetical protein